MQGELIELPRVLHYAYEIKFPESKYWCIVPLSGETPIDEDKEERVELDKLQGYE